MKGEVESAGRVLAWSLWAVTLVWLCLRAWGCGCCVSWHLFPAPCAMLLLGGWSIGAVALASLALCRDVKGRRCYLEAC